ncbi:MAG: acyl dehydratase, partial [Betaproteobacteria bacterium]|nr:acyl dehydratase [Betaproteobacteria bacterium]
WRILLPTKHGDTIRMVQKVIEKKETSKADRGVVKFARTVLNQRGETVMEMEATILYRRRGGGS